MGLFLFLGLFMFFFIIFCFWSDALFLIILINVSDIMRDSKKQENNVEFEVNIVNSLQYHDIQEKRISRNV